MFSSAEIILWSQPALDWLDAYITKIWSALGGCVGSYSWGGEAGSSVMEKEQPLTCFSHSWAG